MSNTIKIKKGYDIGILGEAPCIISHANTASHYAIKPTDFKSLKPKLTIKVGSQIKAGEPLFYSKKDDRIKVCAPVSGEVVEIKRGEKRAILEIIIKADAKTTYENHQAANVASLNAEEIKTKMLNSGTWAHLLQRPFNKIANPDDKPKAIFISGFDSAPLAPNYSMILGNQQNFQIGIDALKKLTEGKIYLNLDANVENCKALSDCKNVVKTYFDGPHPAGNIGTQINHLNPINKGEVVWTINPQDVLIIGNLFKEGIYKADRMINIAGPAAKKPSYYKTVLGTSVSPFVNGNTHEGCNRIISGNALTGTQVSEDGYLGFYEHQITVLEDNTESEFFGWVAPTYARPSFSHTFLNYLNPAKKYNTNTNMHGEERALVFSGYYDKVMPMDILPLHLIKAALANDIDKMEELGIYEVVEEDFALAEFICPSKAPLQKIIGEGLSFIEEEA